MNLTKTAGRWLMLLLLAWPAVAQAQFTFTTNNGAITITGWTGTNGLMVIPDSTNGYPVTGVGTNAFGGYGGIGIALASLTNVIIGANVTEIASGAFEGSSYLTNVTFGAKVADIGIGAFYGCSSLTNLVIPESATNLGNLVFFGCSGLTQITLGNHVATIGSDAFNGCSGLTRLTLPNSVTNIGIEAFAGCSSLTSITVGAQNSFFSSSLGVLYDKHRTTLVAFPDGVGGRYSVVNGVTSIASGAFYGCSNLTSVTIPNTVTSIGVNAFFDCIGLNQVTLGNNIASIGREAFNGCSSLVSITIPNSVTNLGGSFGLVGGGVGSPEAPPIIIVARRIGPGFIGPVGVPAGIAPTGVFGNCTNLTAITVAAQNLFYSSVNGILFDKRQATLIEAPGGITGSFSLAHKVTTVANTAFAGCTRLTGITMPDSVASIGYGAFDDCVSLANVTLGNQVANLGDLVFAGCTGLTTFAISDSVTNVGNGAFEDCFGLTNVTLGSHVTTMGSMAFAGCAGLTGFVVPDSVTNVGSGAFDDCSSLTNVTVGTGVAGIGEGAFAECPSMAAITVAAQNRFYSSSQGVLFDKPQTTLIQAPVGGVAGSYTIPGTVTSIAAEAFVDCTNLTSITIPDSVTNIGDYAFVGCLNLIQTYCEGNAPNADSTVFGFPFFAPIPGPPEPPIYFYNFYSFDQDRAVYHLPGTTGWTTTFGGLPAYLLAPPLVCSPTNGALTIVGYTSLSGVVTIPAAINETPVTGIADGAFANDGSLTNVILGTNLTDIGLNAFSGCTNLTGITFPDSIANIKASAFYGCTNLTSITFPPGVTNLGDDAFGFCNSLKSVYFKGDAPAAGLDVFWQGTIIIFRPASAVPQGLLPILPFPPPYAVSYPVVYYLPDTQGWGTTFAGCPTVLWNPQVQPGDTRFGVRTNQFGFNITGSSNLVVVVEASTNFDGSSWMPISTNRLNTFVGTNGTSYFTDPQWANYPARFYRFRSP